MRARHLLKTLVLPAIHRSGALGLVGRLFGRGGDLALNYHNVLPGVFEAHARFLERHAQMVTLEEFLRPATRPADKPRVLLSFDDGYLGFPRDIVPILERHGLPAAWFVPTALVGTDEVSWLERLRYATLASARTDVEHAGRRFLLESWNREYVASALCASFKDLDRPAQRPAAEALIAVLGEPPPELLAALAVTTPEAIQHLPPLITVGSHTHTHPQLPQQTDAEIRDELRTSRRLLEEWWGRPVQHFAFPSGDQDERVRRLVRESGYVSAWTTEARFRSAADDVFRMPRVPIDDRATLAVLAAKLTPAAYRLGIF